MASIDQQTVTRELQVLEVTSGDKKATVRPDDTVTIGRDAANDLVVEGTLISRRHAEVIWNDDGWFLRDLGSRNGVYSGGEKAAFVAATDGGEVHLGSADGPAVSFKVVTITEQLPVQAAPPQQREATQHEFGAGRIRLGRGADNDIVLTDLRASRNHAELRHTATGGFEVVDLGSRNGTFHNGKQITPRQDMNPGDMISIGRHEFIFDGARLHEFEDAGPSSLIADDLTVRIKDAVLLDDVSFALAEGSVLAIIGPSGCGKSTLVKAVAGLRPATQGQVRYDGRDLYADYAELRYRIGMVPQDDVLHRQLTVRRALRFAAALRFADDVPRKERSARVAEVLETLNLTERAKQRIDSLSGGQRKRVSVALELLTEPSLLFLDEPTSGLDPALDKEVMEELRELADKGRTVAVVTHNVMHLDLADRVLVLTVGGRMGYFGPPGELLQFFGAEDYAEVFREVTNNAAHWVRRYRSSPEYTRYVTDQIAEAPPPKPEVVESVTVPARAVPTQAVPTTAAVPAGPGEATAEQPMPARPGPAASPDTPSATSPATSSAPSPAAGRPGGAPAGSAKVVGRARVTLGGASLRSRVVHPAAPVRQFLTLCARMLWVIGADRGLSIFMVGLPLALALLTRTVPGENGLAPGLTRYSLEAQRLLVVLAVGAAFLGTAAAIRELVNESTIYKRERAVGLSAGAYLASKVVVFSLIIIVQTSLFSWLALLGKNPPKDPLIFKEHWLVEITIPVALVALASMAFGLMVSALVKTTEQTTPVLVVAVMAQLVLSGGLFELGGEKVLSTISWFFPTRWGMAAGGSSVDLTRMIPFKDDLWQHTTGAWWRSVLILVLQIVVLVALARLALRRSEPGRQ
ncbi:ATP-binding cassette domain-containing protein [Dactylosporangium vinaceum]|uniref:ATP-binding cassette domain-containing protein n=1 Tax=Dactylosporangium vinaceum TaxID=53362 RepID=A0ABV5MHC0_9ACTN|nr:ATP-binding cassette domain-containing protein [Dactylosporangium vinaceum]UAB94826.1 ATP-binding cassette domain-containing protein [Dactylosporangium vinaceum]